MEQMGTKEKLVERFKGLPTDFTFAGHRPIMLHKPHPENTMKAYAMKQLLNDLVEAGYIEL